MRRGTLLIGLLALALPAAPAHAGTGGGPAGDAPPTATARAAQTGGVAAADASGGTPPGAPLARAARRPVATSFRVAPSVLTAGAAPAVWLRIDQAGVASVHARVVLRPLGADGAALSADLGEVPTGRRLQAAWPAGAVPAAGRYTASLHVVGAALRRRATASGRTTLTVRPAPAPPASVAPAASPVTSPTNDTSATSADGVFPVQGPHSFGGDGARFGVGRAGHVHQGQDVVAAAGLPVVAPLAGTIVSTSYQAAGAGYYVVQDAVDGRSFFFAHCLAGSVVVRGGQAVVAGQQLCQVGATGDASGPHLHFEIWTGGWRRDAASTPVDPLPQLLAWDR